jgi:AbrB family looped-hinge helix DNA binding protein
MDGMRTTIDKAGRLVVPRSLRGAIGLAEGGPVEIELDGAGIRIEPVAGQELREEQGLLLIPGTGKPIGDAVVRGLIDADRYRP